MNKPVRFISKHSNLRLVLRPGIPGNHLTGQQPVPAIYVRFQDGVAVLNDEELIEKMVNHPSFNRDFIKVEEADTDPYSKTRKEKEPRHIVSEMEYGYVGKTVATGKSKPLSPELEALVNSRAKEIAKDFLEEFFAAKKADEVKEDSKAVEKNDDKSEVEDTKKPAKKAKSTKKTGKKESKKEEQEVKADQEKNDIKEEEYPEPIEAGQL